MYTITTVFRLTPKVFELVSQLIQYLFIIIALIYGMCHVLTIILHKSSNNILT